MCASLSGRHEGHASWPQVESVWNAPDSSTLRNKPQLQGRRERDLHHPLKPHTPAHTSSMHCAFLTSDINLTHTDTHTHTHKNTELGRRAMWGMNGIKFDQLYMIKACFCVHWHSLHLPSQRLQMSATHFQHCVYVMHVFFSQAKTEVSTVQNKLQQKTFLPLWIEV